LIEPRFPGGTGGAVAADIRALGRSVELAVFDLGTRMMRERPVNPAVLAALESQGLALLPAPAVVRADTIVLHNPACLKLDDRLAPRLSAARLIVVTHENFLRPGGAEAFDVARSLALVAGRACVGARLLAPVSAPNRATVAAWLAARDAAGWQIAEDDWPNILDHPLLPPVAAPRDRRGRHSRPGFEKFPPLDDLRAQFPPHAESCTLLGADTLLLDREALPRHWQLLPFGATAVPDFLAGLDFFVYFTHPLWRESFGRAIAEAIAAGKLVITDPATAEPFGPGVIGCATADVDRVVAAHVADPARYRETVLAAQTALAAHRPEAVAPRLLAALAPREDPLALL
jgi:hypothetical protein